MGPVAMWLIERGPSLGLGLTAIASLAAALFGARLQRGCARLVLRHRLRSAGEPRASLPPPGASLAVIEGTLEGDSSDGVLAVSGYLPRTREVPRACASWQAPTVALATPRGRVSLGGIVLVVAGRSVPNDLRLGEPEDVPFDRVLTLRVGDRVRVSGIVAPLAPSRPTGAVTPRGDPPWQLVAGSPGVIPAFGVELPMEAPGLRRRLVAAAVTGLCVTLLGAVLGAAALARAAALQGELRREGEGLVCEGRGTEWGALAAVSPFTRERALALLRRSLGCRRGRGLREALERDELFAIASRDARDARSLCLERAAALEASGLRVRAARVLERCGGALARREAARLWSLEGCYDRASVLARGWALDLASVSAIVEGPARWHLRAGDRAALREALDRAVALRARSAVDAEGLRRLGLLACARALALDGVEATRDASCAAVVASQGLTDDRRPDRRATVEGLLTAAVRYP